MDLVCRICSQWCLGTAHSEELPAAGRTFRSTGFTPFTEDRALVGIWSLTVFAQLWFVAADFAFPAADYSLSCCCGHHAMWHDFGVCIHPRRESSPEPGSRNCADSRGICSCFSRQLKG